MFPPETTIEVFNPVEMIARRRANEREDTDEELRLWIQHYVDHKVPDYQMAAWLMAVCFNPLSPRETATLTRCYAESGVILQWPSEVILQDDDVTTKTRRRPPLVDKHSSGGVGDKVSLILAPLVAACDDMLEVWVPMMAGRGLGHTGGTIDKLESFVGYTAVQSVDNFQQVVEKVGCAIVCASQDICPADQRVYALRDVTSTVQSLPLQTSSIMSKKIAVHPDSIVLDVKFGNGSFSPSIEEALALAESMVAVGEANGLHPTTAFLTDMNHPLGSAVGNWLEVKECIEIPKGNIANESLRLSQDLITLIIVQAGQMLYQSQCYGTDSSECPFEPKISMDRCIEHAFHVLDSGRALNKFREMLLEQGADQVFLRKALQNPEGVGLASYVASWICDKAGYIHDIPAKSIGDISVATGAGRMMAGETVDLQSGIILCKKVGDLIAPGDVVVQVFTNQSQSHADHSLELIRQAVVVQHEPPEETKGPLISHVVTRDGTKPFCIPEFLLTKFSYPI